MSSLVTIRSSSSVPRKLVGEAPESARSAERSVPRDFSRRAQILPYFDVALNWSSALITFLAVRLVKHWTWASFLPDVAETRVLGLLFVQSILVVLLAKAHGLYYSSWKRSFREELMGLGESILSAAVVIGIALFFSAAQVEGFLISGLTIITGWVAMAGWRRFLHSQSIPGLTERRNVVIIGAGQSAMRLQKYIEENPELGFVIRGFIDRRKKTRTDSAPGGADSRFLGDIQDLPAVIRAHFVDEIFISIPGDEHLVRDVAVYARRVGVQLRVVPDFLDKRQADTPFEFVGELPTMTLHEPSIPTMQLIFKRLFDIVAATALLIFLAPLMAIVALLICYESKGPVLYRSLRVGRKGNTFVCFKFRTMVPNAEALKASLAHLNERDNILFKISNDPRITPLGRILRKYSLDELPQFFNVISGDMSLVGPRPPVPDEYQKYALDHLRRLDVTPGVTGLWQVTARRCPSFENYIQLDREYVENWSFWLDFKILWKTIGVTLAGTGQ